jgi:putative endonuclease
VFATKAGIGYTAAMDKAEARYYVYILRCTDGSYYTGWTTDVARRLREHNAGRGARYTRQRGPVELVYWETQPNRSSAMKRENQIKRQGRRIKERLVEENSSSG